MTDYYARLTEHGLGELIHETIECRLKFTLRLANHSLQERMRELAPYCGSNLCDFLRRSEPIKPCHQRSVQACRDRYGG
jgi:hypothetical protein